MVFAELGSLEVEHFDIFYTTSIGLIQKFQTDGWYSEIQSSSTSMVLHKRTLTSIQRCFDPSTLFYFYYYVTQICNSHRPPSMEILFV